MHGPYEAKTQVLVEAFLGCWLLWEVFYPSFESPQPHWWPNSSEYSSNRFPDYSRFFKTSNIMQTATTQPKQLSVQKYNILNAVAQASFNISYFRTRSTAVPNVLFCSRVCFLQGWSFRTTSAAVPNVLFCRRIYFL